MDIRFKKTVSNFSINHIVEARPRHRLKRETRQYPGPISKYHTRSSFYISRNLEAPRLGLRIFKSFSMSPIQPVPLNRAPKIGVRWTPLSTPVEQYFINT